MLSDNKYFEMLFLYLIWQYMQTLLQLQGYINTNHTKS